MSFTVEKGGANALNIIQLWTAVGQRAHSAYTHAKQTDAHTCALQSRHIKRASIIASSPAKKKPQAILQRSQRKLNKWRSDWLSTLVFKAHI